MTGLAPTADGAVAFSDNLPPDPFDALAVHTNDLLDQARGVTKVENAEQLAAVKALEDELATAFKLLEDLRGEKKKPLDEQIKVIQDTFNVYVAPLKNKVPGKIPLALNTLLKAREPYQQEQDRIKREAAEAARLKAEEAARIAAEAARAAQADDLEAREEAEALIQSAAAAQRNAARAEKATTTGTGLRSYWVADLVDPMAALKHYMVVRNDELKAWLNEMARKDVAGSIRTIPGFEVREERRAA